MPFHVLQAERQVVDNQKEIRSLLAKMASVDTSLDKYVPCPSTSTNAVILTMA